MCFGFQPFGNFTAELAISLVEFSGPLTDLLLKLGKMIYLLDVSEFFFLLCIDSIFGQQKAYYAKKHQQDSGAMLERNCFYLVLVERDNQQNKTGKSPEKKQDGLSDNSCKYPF